MNYLPLPADSVSTVNVAGVPTTGPTGNKPGPYADILIKKYSHSIDFVFETICNIYIAPI